MPKVVSSNPIKGYQRDIFTLFCRENCIVCLKRPKMDEKEAGNESYIPKSIIESMLRVETEHSLSIILSLMNALNTLSLL